MCDLIDTVNAVVGKMARKLPTYTDRDELRAIGYEEAVRAERAWDSKRGIPLGAYVAQRVRWHIQDSLRTREYRQGATVLPFENMVLFESEADEPDSTATVAVRRAMRYLTPWQREVVFRVYWLDHRTTDIARERGVTQSAVSTALRDARARMASELEAPRREIPGTEICRNGHVRTPENTRIKASGYRTCVECEREREKTRVRGLHSRA